MRYPGDQDPTSISAAEDRELISNAIYNLGAGRRYIKKLLKDGLVDNIFLRRSEEPFEEYFNVVFANGELELSWPAYLSEGNRLTPVERTSYVVRRYGNLPYAVCTYAEDAVDYFRRNI